MESQNSIFEDCFQKLMDIGTATEDKELLLALLTKLNSLNYNEKIPFITTWTCTDLLLHVISLLKDFGKEEPFVALLCQLIVNIASKQKVVISSMSVNVILHGLKDAWYQVLACFTDNNTSKDLCSHLLRAIAAVVYGNGAYIMPEIVNWLTGKDEKSGSIGQLLLSPVSVDLKKLCLQCLSGLCIPSESRENLNEDSLLCCLKLFVQMLQNIPPIKDVSHYRAIFASHKGLQYILEGQSNIYNGEIGPLLGILKKHMVFGLATPSDYLPAVLTPVPIPPVINSGSVNFASSAGSHSVKKKKKKRNRHKLSHDQGAGSAASNGVQNSRNYCPGVSDAQTLERPSSSQMSSNKFVGIKFPGTSSESDYSDTEGGQFSAITSFASRIRQMAIGSLHAIVKKTSKVLMLGYWNSFVGGSSAATDVSLLSCIIYDPAPKARVGALMVLSSMLEGSKTFLSLGIQKGDSSAFVSFSSMLSSSVCNIHTTLLKALPKERSVLVRVHILKCLSMLAANTPYLKLPEGFITSIFSKIKTVSATSHDNDSKVGVLNIYTSILGNDPALPEVTACITNQNNSDGDGGVSRRVMIKSCLVEDCLGHCESYDVTPHPLQVAALQVLTVASKMYFPVVKHYFTNILTLVSTVVARDDPTVQLHGFKLTEEFGASLLRAQRTDKSMIEKGLEFWKALLSGLFQKIIANGDPASRSYVCNCLATMGSEVFDRLESKLQRYCQTLLLGLTGDESYLVRSESIRALAVYIMYPVLRKDVGFVEDVATCILRLMKDKVKGVQYNAAWSFGNFTDAIVINVENEPHSFSRSMLRKCILYDMLQSAISSFDNKDKVRFNMMRVLGNIVRFCNETHFSDDRFRNLVIEAKSIMVNAILRDPLMKVRWNACLACGNMLRNTHLPVGEASWSDDVYNALTCAVSSSKNYKVSIKAAIALGCPPNREALGEHFLKVYTCVLQSLINSETNEVDIGEYKFKDKLQNQLICTLLHLTSFIKVKEISVIVSVLSEHGNFERVKSQVAKWYNALFVDQKLANLTLDDVGSYAALGQFTVEKKQGLYMNASQHWQGIFKDAADSNRNKSHEVGYTAAHFYKLFSLETFE